MTHTNTEAVSDAELLHKQLRQLAVSMAREFYPEVPEFRPLEDALGLLSQIDNMTTGLSRRAANSAVGGVKALEAHLIKFAEKVGPLYVEDIREFSGNLPPSLHPTEGAEPVAWLSWIVVATDTPKLVFAHPGTKGAFPVYTRPASPVNAEVTAGDAAPFKAGDPVTLPGVGDCVVQQCFYGVGGWRVIAKGPTSRANPKGLYDFLGSAALNGGRENG